VSRKKFNEWDTEPPLGRRVCAHCPAIMPLIAARRFISALRCFGRHLPPARRRRLHTTCAADNRPYAATRDVQLSAQTIRNALRGERTLGGSAGDARGWSGCSFFS
jgi:hypothetical protein